MLKTRISLALFVILLMTTLAGGVGIFLLRNTVAEFQKVADRDFQAIKVLNDFRLSAAELEALYLSYIVGDKLLPEDSNQEPYKRIRSIFDKDIEVLNQFPSKTAFSEAEKTAIESLDESVKLYFERFSEIFEPEFADLSREDRVKKRQGILKASYAMAEAVETSQGLFEASVASANIRATRNAYSSMYLLWGITIAAAVAVLLAYSLFAKRIIEPISGLTESIREVQKQNFEKVVPVESDDEIGELAAAFNDMSAELRIMKMESDQELVRLNHERSAIFNGFPHPVYMLDEGGKLMQHNPVAARLAGRLGIEGKLPAKIAARAKFCVENDSEFLPEEINEAILIRVKERENWYLPRIFKIYEEYDNSLIGWAIVLMDVTRVRFLDDIRNDVVGTISHEIKTPLTSIRMILHLLAEQKTGDLNEMQEKMVVSARDDCERLLETLELLLQQSRVQAGHTDLEIEPVSPADLIGGIADSYPAQIASRGLEVIQIADTELPRVQADRSRIEQVLGNFFSNAIKYSSADSVIEIKAGKSGKDFIRFSVVNQGAGIPEGEQDRIFDRFYRTKGQDEKGTGLGLWISREIIRAHHGRIGVESSSNQSRTEFYFELPLSS